MTFSWKFLQIFLVLFAAVGDCRLLYKTSLTSLSDPFFYVSELINDWDEKKNDISQVMVFDIGKKSDIAKSAMQLIAKDHPVVIADYKKCLKVGKRDSNFIVIVTDTFFVSGQSCARSFRNL